MLKINLKNKLWFTLIEILVWILITTVIIIIWFQALTAITIWKVKLIESTNIEKETFFFNQKLFEEIKMWWLVDYEEYFNRQVVWNTTYLSGHYAEPTWFGNFWRFWTNNNNDNVWSTSYWAWSYYCRSGNLSLMWTWGCVSNFNDTSVDYNWIPQRYGQYSFQFIDYNSNHDGDLWDEDWVNWIIWDDDDEYIGDGPSVFTSGFWVTELYLISADKKKRTYFRWTVEDDIYAPDSVSCDFSTPEFPTWSWCLGTIEFLKLEWRDPWPDHDWSVNWKWQGDWVIDTWYINKDFAWTNDYSQWVWVVAWSNNENYRLPLFPDSINVANFEVFAYPNKDIKEAWKNSDIEVNTAPYVRLKLKLLPSRKTKKKIKWKIPEFEISTTISLTDIYSR